jgi:hypothetical protein
MDIAEMERALKLVRLLRYDRKGKPIDDGRPADKIEYLNQVQFEEADWQELCRRFQTYRSWAFAQEGVVELKTALFEAEQVAPAVVKDKK